MDRIQIIDSLLSQEECQELVQLLEDSPLLQAERNGANYDRSVFYDRSLANKLASRIAHLIPSAFSTKMHESRRPSGIAPININAVELSDRFRFSKYTQGGKFSLHQDGIHQDPRTGYRSALTLSVFLNDNFTGGETVFFEGHSLQTARNGTATAITPKAGKAILFPREIYQGNEVLSGNKYLLRTDVMVAI